MTPSPETSESLLIRVRDRGDVTGWQQFVMIYRPMIYRIARRSGLQDSDAEDLAQRVLLSISRAIVDWEKDPARGSFRSWLSRVARNAIINFVTRGPREMAVGGTDFLAACGSVPSPVDGVEQLIREEHARSRLRAAASQVKATVTPSTWDAFWMTTVEGTSIEDAGAKLGLSSGAIYGARGRVMKQLQAAAQSMAQDELPEEIA